MMTFILIILFFVGGLHGASTSGDKDCEKWHSLFCLHSLILSPSGKKGVSYFSKNESGNLALRIVMGEIKEKSDRERFYSFLIKKKGAPENMGESDFPGITHKEALGEFSLRKEKYEERHRGSFCVIKK